MGLSLRGTTSGAVDINAPAVAGDNTITLPGTNGAANQFYKNSGTAGIVTYSSMVEDSSGNVGIGSTIPQDELDVHGNIITGGLKLVNNDRGNLTRKIVIGSSSVYHLRLYDPNDTTKLQSVFKVDGTVGIGTDNPVNTLHVLSAGTVARLESSTSTTSLRFANSAANDGYIKYISQDLIFTTADTERMRIDSSGRLLVGTSSTSWPYKIVSEGGVGFAAGTLAITRGQAGSATALGGDIGYLAFGGNDNSNFAQISAWADGATGSNDYPGRLVFATTADGASSPTERMRIANDGTISLKTTGTNYRGITIAGSDYGGQNGSIRIKPGTIPGSGTANFVTFFQGYNTAGGSTNHNVRVEGSLSKGSGSFRITHPLPALNETHDLVHSFIEGPQADLIYRGYTDLVDGQATVNIDTASRMTEGTFEVLCRNVSCFTSNESDWGSVKGSVTGNILTIISQDPIATSKVSWMVVGERKDSHMFGTDWTDENGHVITEPLKSE